MSPTVGTSERASISASLPWWRVLEEELREQGLAEDLRSRGVPFDLEWAPRWVALQGVATQACEALAAGPTKRARQAGAVLAEELAAFRALAAAVESDRQLGGRPFLDRLEACVPHLEKGNAALGSAVAAAVQAHRAADFERRWLKELIALCHAHPRMALCLSGGGIRSATFGLGVLQALAKRRVLTRLDYLSTVSGGGYLGGWFSAWVSRRDGKTSDVQAALADHQPKWTSGAGKYAHGPEPQPESLKVWRLRASSNYLAPHLGVLSADIWTLVALMVRNLLVHWTVLVPLLVAALLVPRLALAAGHLQVDWSIPFGVGFSSLAFAFVLAQKARKEAVAERSSDSTYALPPWFMGAGILTLTWAWSLAGLHGTPGVAAPLDGATMGKVLAALTLLLVLTGLQVRWMATASTRKWSMGLILAGGLGAVGGWGLWFLALANRPLTGLDPSSLAWMGTGMCAGVLSFYLVAPILSLSGTESRALAMDLGIGLLLGLGVLLVVRFGAGLAAREEGALVLTLGPLLLGALAFLLTSLVLAVLSRIPAGQPLVGNLDREWYARLGAWSLIIGVGWALLSGLSLFGGRLLAAAPKLYGALTGSSLLLAVWGVLTSSSRGEGKDGAKGFLATKAAPLAGLAGALLIPVLLVVAINGVRAGFTLPPPIPTPPEVVFALPGDPGAEAVRAELRVLAPAPPVAAGWLARVAHWERMATVELKFRPDLELGILGAVLLAALLWVWAATRAFPLQEYSLHSLYRNRLVRAYLGASQPSRHPDPFTGFSEKDDLPLMALKGQRPLLVVNVALNETHGEKLGWQERKASSFTLSPLHCGAFFRVGYRRTDSGYGGPISLGTAMAVSGAAASPNMGYHSSPLLAFIMTFFTIRLGGWLPNPGPKGAGVWPKAHPTFSLKPLLSEALGFSTAESPFVNLSDGGHFENLGLYEMVARRCRLIVVSDAGADREFGYEDLGNALKKIRIDLGIPITFEGELLRKEKEGNPWGADGAAVQIGMIHYDAVDRPEGASEGPKNGCLIYLKPHLWKGAEDKPGLPPDILTYALAHPDFPHETTGDQFFTESQFEGYRALGFEVASAIPESRLSFTI